MANGNGNGYKLSTKILASLLTAILLYVIGVTAEYWQIYKTDYNKDSNKTLSRMRCYVNATARSEGIGNYINMPDFLEAKSFNGEKSVAECYAAWKEPEYRKDETHRTAEELADLGIYIDAERYILVSEGGEKRDFNEFSQAVDC